MRKVALWIITVPLLSVCVLGSAKPRESKFGHLKYSEAPASDLMKAGSYRGTRSVQMRKDAAKAFKEMQESAKRDGIKLVPISGFRTVNYQKGLFDRAKRKQGSTQGAAKWVAPPGFSEHHTGRALDIGDESRPDADVDSLFEQTPAYRWLEENARRFNFELSFPKNNSQGVSHEPWHWRFVGTDSARQQFHPN